MHANGFSALMQTNPLTNLNQTVSVTVIHPYTQFMVVRTAVPFHPLQPTNLKIK